ncbi:MAG: hypothetical protein WC943_07915 [Elusimicrobiota bacterium]|jgi:tetratricopeptide (TPR) repeat protein
MARWNLRRLVPLILGLLAAGLCLGRFHEDAVFSQGDAFHESLAHGEAFLHGVPADPGLTYRMPLGGVALSLFRNHLPDAPRTSAAFLIWASAPLLAFQAGLLAAGPWVGTAAALLCCLPLPFNSAPGYEEQLYRVLLLLAACLTAWRGSRPSPLRSAVLGLALGTSLLCRSPLFLFPFVLAFQEAWHYRSAGNRPSGWGWGAGLLCVLPFVPLIPWIALNLRLGHGLVLFEHGRIVPNLVTGALGHVSTAACGAAAPAGLEQGGSALAWAANEAARHPLRTASAVLARLWFVFCLQPALITAAAAGLWMLRRSPEARGLALFAGYFIVIHCLLVVDARYFGPIWPVLAVLASGLAAPLANRGWRPGGRPWLAWSAAAPVLLLAAFSLSRVHAYGRGEISEEEAFAESLARHPEDPWIRFLQGRWRMRRGEPLPAVSDFSRAKALEPGHFPFESSLTWARTAAGLLDGPGLAAERAAWDSGLRHDWGAAEKDFLALSLDLLRTLAVDPPPRRSEAGGLWSRVESAWRLRSDGGAPGVPLTRRLTELASAWPSRPRLSILKALAARAPDPGLEREATLLAENLGEHGDAEAGLRRLLAAAPGDADLLLRLARLELRLGRRASALAGLEKALSATADSDLRARAAILFQEAGEAARSLGILDPLAARRPSDARLRNNRGVALSLLGRTSEARREFEAAIRLDPRLLPAYLSLGGLQASTGDREAGLRTFEAGLSAAGRGSGDEVARMLRAEIDRLSRSR